MSDLGEELRNWRLYIEDWDIIRNDVPRLMAELRRLLNITC